MKLFQNYRAWCISIWISINMIVAFGLVNLSRGGRAWVIYLVSVTVAAVSLMKLFLSTINFVWFCFLKDPYLVMKERINDSYFA